MKKFRFLIVLIIIFAINSSSLFSQTVYSDSWDGMMYLMLKTSAPEVESDGKIVNIEDFKVLDELADEFGIFAVEKINYFSPDADMRRIFRVYFENYTEIDLLIKKLLQNKDVKYAERSPILETFSSVDDSDYLSSVNNRWHLDVINAEAAWEFPRQTNQILIAVVDKAMDMDHPDLVNQYDVLYDIFEGDFDTNPPPSVADNHQSWSHGTHVSGLAGATTNNGIGIASIAYDTRLMAIKITNDYPMNIGGISAPSGSMIAAYEGVTWAADNGADIINMSWGGRYYSIIKQEIMNYAAVTRSCLLFAGAGNNGEDYKFYPAALDNVIAVAATNGDDKLNAQGMPPLYVSAGSNYGDWIDLCAPGFGRTNSNDQNTVYSTSYNDSYMTIGGTSMATPIVSGLAALIKSINPDLPPAEVLNIIKSTCVDISDLQIDNGRKNGTGNGRIDAEAAAEMAYNSIGEMYPDFSANIINIVEGESINFTDISSGNGINSWTWSFPGATTTSSNLQNPINIVYSTAGFYDVSLEISNGTETKSITKTALVKVRPTNSRWIEQSSGFETSNRSIRDIAIATEDIAWATAYDGVNMFLLNEFTRTNNRGQTWIPGEVSAQDMPPTYRISNISPINYNIAYACMHNSFVAPSDHKYGGIYITNNGGETWQHQASAMFNDENSIPNFVHFFNENDGVTVGNPAGGYFEIYTTNDGGENWARVAQTNIPSNQGGELGIIGKYEYYQNILWFPTDDGRVYKSIDKGQTWTVSSTGLSKITNISFADENIGIVQNIAFNMWNTNIITFDNKITNNGGQSWSTLNPDNQIRQTSIDFVPGNPDLLISVGTDGTDNEMQGSSYSTDRGLTWTTIDEGVYYGIVKMYNDNVGFAGSLNISSEKGGMFRWKPESVINEVNIYNDVQDITVDFGTSEQEAISQLAQQITISDSDNETYVVNLSWSVNGYNGEQPDIYSATGTFTLPSGVLQSNPETDLFVSATITVLDEDIIENTYINEVDINNDVQDITVDFGTSEQEAISQLAQQITISDNNNETYVVVLSWTIVNYNSELSNTYNAIGMFSLPNGVEQSNPPTNLYVNAEVTVDIASGIVESEIQEIGLYPNPASDILNIEIALGNRFSEIEIYNTLGEILHKSNIIVGVNTISIADLHAGVYIVKIVCKNTGKNMIKRFEKM